MLRTILLQVIVGILLSFTPVVVAGVEQVPLPAVWQFQLDPDDIGVHGKWFGADLQSEPWIPLGTHDWEGWENQGQPSGVNVAWYRVDIEVPQTMRDKNFVYLFFSCVDE